MANRINWDEYETALLIDTFWRIEAAPEQKQVLLEQLSKDLRTRATNLGIKTDLVFRNVNGLKMQYTAIEHNFYPERPALTYSAISVRICKLYQDDRNAYTQILTLAKKQVVGEPASLALVMESEGTATTSDNIIDLKSKTDNEDMQPQNNATLFYDIEHPTPLEYTVPTGCTYYTTILNETNWRSLAKHLLALLYADYPTQMAEMRGKRYPGFDAPIIVTQNESTTFFSPYKITNDLFVEMNRSANRLMEMVGTIAKACGVPGWAFHISYNNTDRIHRGENKTNRGQDTKNAPASVVDTGAVAEKEELELTTTSQWVVIADEPMRGKEAAADALKRQAAFDKTVRRPLIKGARITSEDTEKEEHVFLEWLKDRYQVTEQIAKFNIVGLERIEKYV